MIQRIPPEFSLSSLGKSVIINPTRGTGRSGRAIVQLGPLYFFLVVNDMPHGDWMIIVSRAANCWCRHATLGHFLHRLRGNVGSVVRAVPAPLG